MQSAEQAEERFKSEAGFIYSRYANPTVAMFEERMRLLEGAEAARATATGMAAVTAALLCFLKAGDHLVAARALFGSCRYVVEELCPRFGIASTLVDGRDLQAWARRHATQHQGRSSSRRPPIRRSIWSTSPPSPRSPTRPARGWSSTTCLPRRSCKSRCKLGADVVVYSATKHIDGQGRCLGGIVLGSAAYVKEHLHNFLKHTGPVAQPVQCLGAVEGAGDVALARACAMRLGGQDRRSLGRPAGGSTRPVLRPARSSAGRAREESRCRASAQVVTFDIEGGKAAAFRFLNALRLVKISNNLGDAKSIITHPPPPRTSA